MGVSMNYYDRILGGIFASLAAGTSVGLLTNLSMNIGMAIGILPSLVLMYMGMFANAPIEEKS